jgi:putative nucleotidyltransferase with HDIG domain
MLHLRIITGSRKGETVSLDDDQLPLTIGRDRDNRLRLESPAISRFHAVILSEGGNYYLKDLQSTNGTFLNGRRIEREKLSPGDEFAIANVNISVEATQSIPYEASIPLYATVTIDRPMANDKTLRVTQSDDDGAIEFIVDNCERVDLMESKTALQSLYRADWVLRDIEDLNELLDNFVNLVTEVMEAPRGYVFLLNPETGLLMLHVRKAPYKLDDSAEIVVSRTVMDKTIKKGESLLVGSAMIREISRGHPPNGGRKITSSICAPLVSREKVLGLVYLDSRDEKKPFTSSDLNLLNALASKAATAVDNARLYENLRNLFYNTVETLIRTMQAKDKYTSGHSTRVSRFSLLIAEKLGLNTKDKHQLYLAAVLHDIGKIGLPDKLLLRPGKLTSEEMERVREHPQLGVSMIKSLGEMHPIVPLILHHHEAFDGSGYPDGLAGEEIPLMSRIVAVADTYDAITSDRPYRKGRSQAEAIKELKRVAGTKLDPKIVSAFLEVLEEISPKKPLEQPSASSLLLER